MVAIIVNTTSASVVATLDGDESKEKQSNKYISRFKRPDVSAENLNQFL